MFRVVLSVFRNTEFLQCTTRKKRIRAGSKMRTHYANRARDLSELLAKKDMVLVDEQSSKMSNIINIVKDDYSEVVNTVINESTIIETELQAMRNIWLRDCAKKRATDKADFEADQKKILPQIVLTDGAQ